MEKARKGQSTRKPPDPSESHDVIDAWIRSQIPTSSRSSRGWTH